MAEKENQKRKRSANWTTSMKELLIEAVRPVADIIDSKMNDGKNLKLKTEAWEGIAASFRASGFYLQPKQIRDRWSRYKQEARTNISHYKRSQKETGGGKPPEEPAEADYEIAEISAIDFVEDIAEFDSDAIYAAEYNEREIPMSSPPPPPSPPASPSPPISPPSPPPLPHQPEKSPTPPPKITSGKNKKKEPGNALPCLPRRSF
ncbi:histone-lysine N-methyltransferase 2B-like [Episyrphus balteatus]|uniref:histone-lysine N-methyltransferase 2B-like n=1 Tax=Episyrphus balteatus TaxID=286459 RepID=UPI0024858EF0|nr:histone-lysine N-methyltransferase 2B-like [Episyrphus balteatus]